MDDPHTCIPPSFGLQAAEAEHGELQRSVKLTNHGAGNDKYCTAGTQAKNPRKRTTRRAGPSSYADKTSDWLVLEVSSVPR